MFRLSVVYQGRCREVFGRHHDVKPSWYPLSMLPVGSARVSLQTLCACRAKPKDETTSVAERVAVTIPLAESLLSFRLELTIYFITIHTYLLTYLLTYIHTHYIFIHTHT